MRIGFGAILCCLLCVAQVSAETKRYEFSMHNSHYSYRLNGRGTGIEGCDPSPFQCDFILSGTMDIQIADDWTSALISDLDVELVGNETVRPQLPTTSQVTSILEGHDLPLARTTNEFRWYAASEQPFSKYSLWLSQPAARGLLFEGGRDEAMVDGPSSLFLLLALEVPQVLGDYNYDGVLGVADLDLIARETREGRRASIFDLNRDTLTTTADVRVWVHDLARTWLGDANLNGQFSTDDLVDVFQAGKYETGDPASWASGDWNSDGLFNSGDLVLVLQEGGYESGPRPSLTATVPEPGSAFLLLPLAWFAHRIARRTFAATR